MWITPASHSLRPEAVYGLKWLWKRHEALLDITFILPENAARSVQKWWKTWG